MVNKETLIAAQPTGKLHLGGTLSATNDGRKILDARADPEQCKFLRQSPVIGDVELRWIFGRLTPIDQLDKMTQCQDESNKIGKSVCCGLLYYLVLMMADILLHNAHLVSIGEDQKKHLEITREIGHKCHNVCFETFVLPE
jgi:tryptophanyl-tRNA synthetase